LVSPGLPTVMGVDGCAGRERDLRRAPQAAGPLSTVAVIVGPAFVTVVTWPGW
jgi:hypothetical protein